MLPSLETEILKKGENYVTGDKVIFSYHGCETEGIILKEYASGALLVEDIYPNLIGEYDAIIVQAEDIIDIPAERESRNYLNPIWKYAAITLIVLPLIIKMIELIY